MKESSIPLGNTQLFYKYSESTNGKKNFLILHGWGGKSDSWLNVGKVLEKQGFGVYIPDLPGFGKTKITKTFSLNDYANIVEDFVVTIGIENIILVGHSNGGAIATKLVLKNTLNIKKLILNNSAGVRNDFKRKLKRILLKPFAIVMKTMKFLPFYQKIRTTCYKLIGSRDFLNAEKTNPFLKNSYLKVISSDITRDFQKINTDTLLVWGEKDSLTPLSDARHIRLNIKDSKLLIVPGRGHSIHIQSPLELSKIFIEAAK